MHCIRCIWQRRGLTNTDSATQSGHVRDCRLRLDREQVSVSLVAQSGSEGRRATTTWRASAMRMQCCNGALRNIFVLIAATSFISFIKATLSYFKAAFCLLSSQQHAAERRVATCRYVVQARGGRRCCGSSTTKSRLRSSVSHRG
jgi:hypothetical protein